MNKTRIDWCDFSFNPVTGRLPTGGSAFIRRMRNSLCIVVVMCATCWPK